MTSNANHAARDVGKDAREAVRESASAASGAVSDVQADLEALRSDVADLTKKLGTILSKRGNSAWEHAKAGVEDTIADVESRAREAGDEVTDAINSSLQARPYTTLAAALGLGFLFGAIWRR
jgi:ElaB/YqjD/DUF883 family membrane-anchored ribosome-binding protein